MKLYLYDEKHEQVFGELDLGKLSKDEAVLLDKVIDFLGSMGITSRYKRLVVSESYKYDSEGDWGDGCISFQGELDNDVGLE